MKTPTAFPMVSASPIPTYTIGDDSVVLIGDGLAMVSSKSEPGSWWPIESWRCCCPGFAGIPGKFAGRGRCRHVDAVKAAEDMDRANAEPIPFPTAERCSCGNAWTLRIEGGLYCAQCAPAPTAYHFYEGVAFWNGVAPLAQPTPTAIPRGFLR